MNSGDSTKIIVRHERDLTSKDLGVIEVRDHVIIIVKRIPPVVLCGMEEGSQ